MATYWIKKWPCTTKRITSPYGTRYHPISKTYKLHNGIDLSPEKKVGETIKAIAAGKIIQAGYSSTAGYWVKIDHGNGWISIYMHMRKGLSIKYGQKVKAGQKLGRMGTTGSSTGEHLHFGLTYKGVYKNPVDYLKLIGTTVWSKKSKVKVIQKLIGLSAKQQDGVWGPVTQAAYSKFIKKSANVKKVQKTCNKWLSIKLVIDGINGNKTKTAINALK